MSGKPGRSGVYQHNSKTDEEIEVYRKAYYKWSKRPDPQETKKEESFDPSVLDNSL